MARAKKTACRPTSSIERDVRATRARGASELADLCQRIRQRHLDHPAVNRMPTAVTMVLTTNNAMNALHHRFVDGLPHAFRPTPYRQSAIAGHQSRQHPEQCSFDHRQRHLGQAGQPT